MLPDDVAQECVAQCQKDGSSLNGAMNCVLCGQFMSAKNPKHMCTLGPFQYIGVDTFGLTNLPELGADDVEKQRAMLEVMTKLTRLPGSPCLSLVQLPKETSWSATLTYLGTSTS